MCWYYRKFGHLVHNYRNKRGEIKGKLIPQNKFEIIASRVIQCRVGRRIKVRRQETVEKVKCFRCWEVGHYKWEYLNIEKRRKNSTCSQTTKGTTRKKANASQWEKAQEYCREESMPSEDTLLLERGWITREMVVMYINCGGYEDKRVLTHEN